MTITTILIFLIILALVVLVHELGHFLAARLFGMRVHEFGFGFPPRIATLGWWKGTRFSLNAIPLGGFVKIEGEDGDETSDQAGPDGSSFSEKPRWQQGIVLVAGVVFNMLSAWLLIIVGLLIGLPASGAVHPDRPLHNEQTVIMSVMPESVADSLGIEPGDRVTSLTLGDVVHEGSVTPQVVSEYVQSAYQTGESLTLDVTRGQEIVSFSVPADVFFQMDEPILGVALETVGLLRLPLDQAVAHSVGVTVETTRAVGSALWGFVSGFFVSDRSVSVDELTGPVGIVSVVDDARALGLSYLIWLTALISINLAFLNLLPFPALDGGRLVVVGIEGALRRPLPVRFISTVNFVGFALLILLMLVVTYYDITKLFSS